MMGVGKSSVGRRLAARLGMPFVDADAEIEKAAGMSIADIFARHGEADFRSGEARVIARLLDGGPQVLATGGGAFMNAGYPRGVIQAKGISIWLSADVDVLMRRISKRRNERPLLQTADPAETLRRLLAEREPIYAQADLTVQSRDVPHDAIVAEIMTALAGIPRRRAAVPEGRADRMTATASRRSHHRQGRARRPQLRHRHRARPHGFARRAHRGAAARAPRPPSSPTRTWRVTILPRAEAALADAGVATTRVIVPAGEGSKSFRVFEQVCEAIIAARIERGDLVVALGGGVIGDLAGFAASVVRRGLDYVQVPTTLLAQVDSSVGGKTAINSAARQESGRRLPSADPGARRHRRCSTRLPAREFRAGYAEVAKYGLLGDAAFFAWLEANWRDVFAGGVRKSAREHAIAVSCRAKAAIVARDERETGERALLNLGHTFGHALEAACGFSDRLLAWRGGRGRHGAGFRLFGAAGAAAGRRSRARHPPSGGGRPADPAAATFRAGCRPSTG